MLILQFCESRFKTIRVLMTVLIRIGKIFTGLKPLSPALVQRTVIFTKHAQKLIYNCERICYILKLVSMV